MDRYYIVPLALATPVGGGPRHRRPKYLADMPTASWNSMDYGSENLAVVRATLDQAQQDFMAAQADVFAMPADMTQQVLTKELSTVQAYLTAAKIPSDTISTRNNWWETLTYIAKLFQFSQRVNGQGGTLFPAGVTLTSPYRDVQAGQKLRLLAAAASLGYETASLSGTTPVAEIIKEMALQYKGATTLGGEPLSEMKMALPAGDTFTNSDGTALTTHSASWSLVTGNFTINTNQVRSNSAGAETAARWSADTFTDDQYAELVFNGFSGALFIGPATRCASGAVTYYAYYSSNSGRYIFKNIAATPTTLAFDANPVTAGATLRLTSVGTLHTPAQNGVTDAGLGAQTDSAIASGWAGISGYEAGVGCRGDTFAADSLGVTSAGSLLARLRFMPHTIGGLAHGSR